MTQRDRETHFESAAERRPPDAFDENRRQIEAAIRPRDRIEQLYAEDFAYSSLQISPLRRAESHFLAARAWEALYAQLVRDQPAMADGDRVALMERWSRGDPEARGEVAAILKNAGLTELGIEFRRGAPFLGHIDCTLAVASI
ncbi:hypothetical protein [Bradyrhizobium vignae]|uniref:hypothetical protein n=1 Tax=Bradyrhizobium vignae TaxID=1549949 RepID=UPI00100B6580|nr:hypothetical protein [Bradyrhizobium vignae]RXG83572.1 hypothetical protein EAV90_39005 [Bradyrhizobium vignae]